MRGSNNYPSFMTRDGPLVRPGLGRDIKQVKILSGKILAES